MSCRLPPRCSRWREAVFPEPHGIGAAPQNRANALALRKQICARPRVSGCEEQDNNKAGIPGLNQIKYLGDIFGNTSKNRTRSEIIVFIRPKVIRNALDAQGVAEEFRERLETIRAPAPVIDGRDVPVSQSPANTRRMPAPVK